MSSKNLRTDKHKYHLNSSVPFSCWLSSPVEAALFLAATSGTASAGGSAAVPTCHTHFNGDGALKLAGLPIRKWASFGCLHANPCLMQPPCIRDRQVNDPLDEISDIKAVANSARVDVRFLFAVIMQVSIGCVRARSTPNALQIRVSRSRPWTLSLAQQTKSRRWF